MFARWNSYDDNHKKSKEEDPFNPNGRYIDFDLYNINEESDAWQDMSGMFHVEQVNGEDGTIHICAIGVDENDRLVFKAEQHESPYNC